MRQEGQGLELGLKLRGLDSVEQRIERGTNRLTLAPVTLGLYVAASLLMQHSIGPRIYGMPLLAAMTYTLALWLTFRLTRSTWKSGSL